MTILRTSIHGKRFGLGPNNELVSNEIRLTSPAVGATITVAASQTSPRAITVQLTDSEGANVAEATPVWLALFLDAAMVAFAATGGSTGLAASAGIIEAVISKLLFFGVTDSTGKFTLSWTDTAHEVAFLGVLLPSDRMAISAALTTA